jgi:hypothetical protein
MPQKRIIVNEDAFFVRYQINGNLIQIIEEIGIVTFIVKELNDNPPVTSDKQIDFAVNFAQKLFNKIVLFNDKQYLHTHSNQVTTEGTWIVWPQKDKEGTSVITFLTDGKFARYVIGRKFTGGMAFPPPEYPHFTGTLPPLYPDRSP